MGARKDMGKTFSKLTQEEVDSFYEQWGIDPSVNPVAPGCDKTVDQCPTGSITLYCRHFEFSNLRYPFFVFVLNVLEYYRVSFGQLHPQGVSRVLHFEVLCRALGYDPNLLMFRRFFHLAKNGDWFTFEKSQIDVSLISSLVTTLGSWKDRLFWVSESVVPFKMVWRHPDAVLNELEPSESELNEGMLKALRAYPSQLRPFLEHLLVFTGVSILWAKPNRDPSFIRGGQLCLLWISLSQMTFLMLFLGIRKPLRVKMPLPGLLRVDWFLGEVCECSKR
uniref:Putative transposase (Putative), gypsy type n=1 Tax=Helianthus annuus TaxID=4232 RepID=A0A251UFF8_HELAN